ncbi:MAG: acyltransferase family protein, partial [Anaerolineales bacterium]|nr:acyltransferase family protein [Anaerolineales bacterium]
MKRNQSIDSMCYLAAFAVVTLHVGYAGLPAAWGENIRLLSRWAVPFFFIISGYFLHAPGKPLSTRASSQIVRLAWLLLFWSLVYTLVNMGEYGIEYGLSMLLRSEVFVYGTYSHLWFLGSAMLGGLALAVIDH